MEVDSDLSPTPVQPIHISPVRVKPEISPMLEDVFQNTPVAIKEMRTDSETKKESEKGEISEEESEEVHSDSDESYTTSSYQSTESPTVERRKKRKFQNFPWFTWTPDKCRRSCAPEGVEKLLEREIENQFWHERQQWLPIKDNFRATGESLPSFILPSCAEINIKVRGKERKVEAFGVFSELSGDNDWNSMENDVYINPGGVVMSMSWCPVGNFECPCEMQNQFLAISADTHKKYHIIGQAYQERALIQIWHCGDFENPEQPTLELCLVHDFGFCWDMQWIPGTIWGPPEGEELNEACFPRLGLLACAHSDGLIRVWSIPHPSALSDEALDRIVYASPVFTSKVENGILWRLKMNPHLNFPYLMGATTDGRVAIWDLSQKDTCEEHMLEMPVHKQGTAVRGIDWNPDMPTQFVTCGEDACLRFWDACEPFCYYLNSTSTRNPSMSLTWLNGTASVVVTSESVAAGESTLTSQGTRVFSCAYRPTMNLAAESVLQFEDYVPWFVDTLITLDEGSEPLEIEDEHVRVLTMDAKVHLAVAYSNGVTAVYHYRLEDVFGKVDDYETTILSLASVDSLPVVPLDVKQEQIIEEDDEKMAEEEPEVDNNTDDSTSNHALVFEGPDAPILVTQRLSKEAKAALCDRDFASNLEAKLMDDMVSTQHVKFNHSAPKGVLQIATSVIAGMVRIQTLREKAMEVEENSV